MKILLALTEEMVARPLAVALEFEGQVVETDPAGSDVLHLLETAAYDALVVDPNLPHDGGLNLIRTVRRRGHRLPVLVLSCFDDVRHKRLCFEAGADDHLMIPFKSEEVFIRLQAIARRSSGHLTPELMMGDLAIDQNRRAVRVGDATIHCTPSEFMILEAMALRPGRLLSVEMLYGLTHDSRAEGSNKVVDVLICRLRKKLAAVGASDAIENIRGLGYRLREMAFAAPSAPVRVAEVA